MGAVKEVVVVVVVVVVPAAAGATALAPAVVAVATLVMHLCVHGAELCSAYLSVVEKTRASALCLQALCENRMSNWDHLKRLRITCRVFARNATRTSDAAACSSTPSSDTGPAGGHVVVPPLCCCPTRTRRRHPMIRR